MILCDQLFNCLNFVDNFTTDYIIIQFSGIYGYENSIRQKP